MGDDISAPHMLRFGTTVTLFAHNMLLQVSPTDGTLFSNANLADSDLVGEDKDAVVHVADYLQVESCLFVLRSTEASDQANDRILRFGDQVCFEHLATGKFLDVSRVEWADHEAGNRKVLLQDADKGVGAPWRLNAPSKGAGEKIVDHSEVILQVPHKDECLHISSRPRIRDGCYEINAATTATDLFTLRIFQPSSTELECLAAGHTVVLFHSDTDATLVADSPSRASFHIVEASALEAATDEARLGRTPCQGNFIIEMENPLSGGVIGRGTAIRFRSLTNGGFLAVVPKEPGSPVSVTSATDPATGKPSARAQYSVVLLHSRYADGTLFTIHPVTHNAATFAVSDRVFIRNQTHPVWLAAGEASAEGQGGKRLMPLIPKFTRSQQAGSFDIVRQQRRIYSEVMFLREHATCFTDYTKLLHDATPDPTQCATMIAATMRLLHYVTEREAFGYTSGITVAGYSADDPWAVLEATPDLQHQQMLVEMGFHDMCLLAVDAPYFTPCRPGTSPSTSPEVDLKSISETYPTIFSAMQHCYMLLTLIVKSRKAGFLLQAHLEICQHQMEHCRDVGSVYVLSEVYKDNPALEVDATQVAFFFRMMHERRKAEFVRFLCSIVECNGKAIPYRQDLVRQIVMNSPESNDCLYRLREGGKTAIEICCPATEQDAPQWRSLAALASSKERNDARVVHYFVWCVQLFATLCMGQNHSSATEVEKFIPPGTVSIIINDPTYPVVLRAAFLNLFTFTQVDTKPFTDVVAESRAQILLDAPVHHRTRPPTPEEVKKLKPFIKDQLAKPSDTNLLVRVLQLVKAMLKFGMYSVQESQELVPHLVSLLEAAPLEPPKKDMAEERKKEKKKLFADSGNVKGTVSDILQKIVDLHTIDAVKSVVEEFGRTQKNAQGDNGLKMPVNWRLPRGQHEKLPHYMQPAIETISAVRKPVNDENLVKTIAAACLLYVPAKAIAALQVLFRLFGPRHALYMALRSVVLLTSRSSVDAYSKACEAVAELRKPMDSSPQTWQALITTIEELTKLCNSDQEPTAGHASGTVVVLSESSPSPRGGDKLINQTLLQRLGVHDAVMDLLRSLRFEKGMDESARSRVQRGQQRCFQFIAAFCQGNEENQLALAGYVDTLMEYRNTGNRVCTALGAIYGGNYKLCSEVPRSVVAAFCDDLVPEKERQKPHYITFLKNLMHARGVLCAPTQALVLRNLLQYDVEVIYLGRSEYQKALQQGPVSQVQYHLEYVDCLQVCGQHQGHLVRQRLRNLVPLVVLFDVLTDREIPARFRAPYVKFFHHVCMEDPNFNPRQYRPFATQVAEWLRTVTWEIEQHLKGHVLIDTSNSQTTFTTVDLETEPKVAQTNRLPFQQHYIVHCVIPALRSCLRNAYCRELVTPITNSWPALVQALESLFSRKEGMSDATTAAVWQPQSYIVALPPDSLLSAVGTQYRALSGKDRAAIRDTIHLLSTGVDAPFPEGPPVDMQPEAEHHQGKALGVAGQWAKCIRAFAEDPRTAYQDLAVILLNSYEEPEMEAFFKKLVSLCEEDNATVVGSILLLLRQFLTVSRPGSASDRPEPEDLNKRQQFLHDCGLTGILLKLICSPSQHVANDAINCGVFLLGRSPDEVQRGLQFTLKDFYESCRTSLRRCGARLSQKKRSLRALVPLGAQYTDEMKNDMLVKFDFSMDVQLVRFLQLMCERQNITAKQLMRDQADNSASINIVLEVLRLLQRCLKCLDFQLVDLTIQLLATLTEFIQGPCVENQKCLMSAAVLDSVGTLIAGGFPYMSTEDEGGFGAIQSRVLDFVLGLLEGRNPEIVSYMAQNFDLDSLARLMTNSHEAWLKRTGHRTSFFSPMRTEVGIDDELSVGCNVICIFRILLDHCDPDIADEYVRPILGKKEHSIFKFFTSITGSIEIIRETRLERVYFRIPFMCRANLREQSKDELHQEIDRSSQSAKLQDFIDRCEGLITEIEYFNAVRQHLPLRILRGISRTMRQFYVIGALVINIILIAVLKHEDGQDTLQDYNQWAKICVKVIGIIQVVNEGLVMFDFFFGKLQIHMRQQQQMLEIRRKEAANRQRRRELNVQPEVEDDSAVTNVSNLLSYLRELVYYREMWKRWLFLSVSIIGLFWPFFYSLQLLSIVEWSPTLGNVVRAVTKNGKALLLTALFGLIMIYIFAFLGFWAFFTAFDNPDQFGPANCDTLWHCLLVQIFFGLRFGGGIGDGMAQPAEVDGNWGGQSVFKFFFHVTLIIIFLNIIFGIILDTFSELRDNRYALEEDMTTKCFICGLDRTTFERDGSFAHHVEFDHNMWNYLYFFHFLQKKAQEENTGQEEYVLQKLKQRNIDFFPIEKAMCLPE
eukprot:TRINITY_DN3662_c0_g1_i1.p1 TRINITY_DN3662_c0_g1~~TRINITY_DN3662_c0_g1_i1.p1  ORF type:complete len:2350 (-),score=412.26 TRINITY_DN3662_c0_g1_i1:15-7031(-)